MDLFEEFDGIANRVEEISALVDGASERIADHANVYGYEPDEVLIDEAERLEYRLQEAYSALAEARDLWEELNENGAGIG